MHPHCSIALYQTAVSLLLLLSIPCLWVHLCPYTAWLPTSSPRSSKVKQSTPLPKASPFAKTGTMAKHVIDSANNTLFAGSFVITPGKCPRWLFQPQRGMFIDANTSIKQEFLLGHSSNDP